VKKKQPVSKNIDTADIFHETITRLGYCIGTAAIFFREYRFQRFWYGDTT